ncbi:MAG: FAD-dependent thymidylate synthase [Clostridia bacterium]|nr:FAD-dependent thymidylate synthase [Clostridia bacterium]
MNKASVQIIGFNPEGISASAAASRISTGSGTALDAFAKSGDREKDLKLIGKVLSSGHNTVIEHVYLTAAFNDVSVLTEQLMIEHRLAAYTVKSRRYVDFSGAGFLVPEGLGDRHEKYISHMERLFGIYDKLLEAGIPREDARFVLPYCFRSNFIMSANAREMLLVADAMIRGRLSVYPEIKQLGEMLLSQIEELFPAAGKALSKTARENEPLHALGEIPAPAQADTQTQLVSSPADAEGLLKSALAFNGRENMSLKALIHDERPRELEMLSYAFRIKDVSLASVTHFTRHRIQSLIVPRPVNALQKNAYVLPDTVKSNPEALALYTQAFRINAQAANEFRNDPELISYFALAGNTVDILFSMNARELVHFLRLRTCTRAQWEIRACASEMLSLLMEEYRPLFKYYGPSCAILGYCPEGRLSCGKLVKPEEE